jgi:hypothetical protein
MRFADRRRVGRVVLVAPHIGLHMRRRDQLHLMPERQQLPPPMMRRGARFHRHHARRQFAEKSDEPPARQLARDDDLALRIDGVNLKDLFRQIEPDPRDSGEIPDRLAQSTASLQMGW